MGSPTRPGPQVPHHLNPALCRRWNRVNKTKHREIYLTQGRQIQEIVKRCIHPESVVFLLQIHSENPAFMLYPGQPTVNKVKIFLLFQSLWNAHKLNFTLITWGNPKLLGQKKSKFIIRPKIIVGSKFSCSTVFSLYWYFIETTTTDTDMLLQVLLQFCNNGGFAANFDVIMLFCGQIEYYVG